MAYFLFTAPPGAKRGCANYDHKILEDFLEKFRDEVSKGHGDDVFTPKVCARAPNAPFFMSLLLH